MYSILLHTFFFIQQNSLDDWFDCLTSKKSLKDLIIHCFSLTEYFCHTFFFKLHTWSTISRRSLMVAQLSSNVVCTTQWWGHHWLRAIGFFTAHLLESTADLEVLFRPQRSIGVTNRWGHLCWGCHLRFLDDHMFLLWLIVGVFSEGELEGT